MDTKLNASFWFSAERAQAVAEFHIQLY